MSMVREGLRRIWGMTYLASRWIIRQPLWLIQGFAITIGFFVLLYAWGGRAGVNNFVIGAVVAGMWGVGINLVGQDIGWYRLMKLYDMFVATELTPTHFILGVFLSSMVFEATTLAAYLPIALAFGAVRQLITALAVGLVELTLATFLGLVVAMRVSAATNVSSVTNTLSSMLQVLPPVYYPAYLLPGAVKYAVMAVPTAAAAELARQLSGLGASVPMIVPLASLCTWVIGAFLAANKVVRWGMA